MTNALVSGHLDYCNSLFKSLSKFNLHKLQCIQNSAARIVSNTSRYTSRTPVLKKLHWLPVEQHTVFKAATLVYKYLHKVFPGILPHIFLPTAVLIVPGAVKVVVISLSFQSFALLFINVSNSLVIVLLLMPLPPWPPSESSLKPTCTKRIPTLAWIIPLAFSMVLDPSYVPGYRNFDDYFFVAP